MNKKKFHGGYGLFFGVLFSLLFVFSSSTCFASMSSDYLQYGVNLLKDNYTGTTSTRTQLYRQSLTLLSSNDLNTILSNINNYMVEYGVDTLSDINIFITINEINDYSYYLRFFFCNNGAPNGINNLSHFLLKRYEIVCYDSQPDYIYTFRQTITLNGNYNILGESLKGKFDKTSYSSINYTNFTFNDNNTVLTINNFVCAGIPTGFCYYPLNQTTNIIPIILKDVNGNYQIITPEPEEPSGDIPNSTGTITNNSGETTGKIDLSGIENGINGVKEQISGDTQRIIDNQNSIAQQQHNDLTSFDVSEGEGDADDLINNIQDTLDDNLSNSQIFGALEESESGFLDLISGQAEDFEIHWNDVFYNNVKLIPAGQVNFSALCRDNSTLGNVKEKLNIILSALCGLALIKYLYNLLLATLGIDNPYLYDKNTDSDYIKTVDKNTGVTTFSGKDKDGSRWTYRFDPRKGGKKK